ncbi:regulator of MON1-CCZ1 complex isoform X1 [Apis mellifera caucasica]|uniref:Regulator of MON1-CCZ1 complex isoform X1 n=2 Tax=Apis TaxID=7459 RepID=A0A7M7GZQ0_APIME|nr:regulator of MON1-CCZ1 complex isoform X1 [Apis mellifera]KAG6801059.1 regulator of MON1-CCZ1 complex isoform X1 [Apis mellifera caucasica]|eukprot:XP_006567414.2 regulator of MON1-CCZ1 complex isoform X1 [Apis mellifera]
METVNEDAYDDYYLELSSDPIKFESVSSLTNVFFDDSKQQVFAVRSGGVTGVSVKGPNQNINFRMEDKGPVISIKFAPDMNILAIQHNNSSVEFINYSPVVGLDNIEYSQSCKGKNATILGFVWTHGNEILLVTDYGVELFQVNPEKRNVKVLKCLSLGVNWFVFCPQSYLVLLSSGTIGNQMQTLHVTPGNLHKLTKFEVEAGTAKPGKLIVYERDVALAVLYGTPCIILLRHQPGANRSTGTASVYVYTVHKMTTIRKSHILKLDVSGKFAINVVDNLIIVHHQTTKTSMIFDIMLPGISDGTVMHHTSVAPAKPIKPYNLKVPGTTLTNETYQSCQLYSPNWVVFQPNIIIDAKLGCLWYIELKLESLVKLITDKVLLVEFLMQRTNTKYILIHVLQNFMMQLPISLMDMPIIFDKLNSVYRNYLEDEIQNQMGTPLQNTVKNQSMVVENYKYKLLLNQSDVYSYILSKFPENTIEPKMIVWILLEYIRSLAEHGIPVQHYLHELVITTLVQRKAYYQLHQLLQYHVVADSKPLACLLLSLENLYPAAHQLALDMLKRLGNAHEEIIEVLLSKGYILPALRYIRSVGMVDQISDRKFLEAAKATGDATLFYSVFKFFKQRNLHLCNATTFTKGERYQPYIQHYRYLFEGIDNDCNSDTNSNVTTIS